MRYASQSIRTALPHLIQNCCNANESGGAIKTLLRLTARGVKRFAIMTLLLSSLALLPARAEATVIPLGEIDLAGSFTLNPAYNFNQPTAQPFGSFGDMTVTQASGIFEPFVNIGDLLMMNTPYVLSEPFNVLYSTKPLAGQMIWSIGGFTIATTWTNIAGADSSRSVLGLIDLSFGNFDFQNDPNLNGVGVGTFGYWDFHAPPYNIGNFTSPITGPINLTIRENYEDGHVPEPSSLLLLGLGLIGFIGWRERQRG